MKIIIPVAGRGTRLRPHTYVLPKPLIRVAGRPIIDYIIEQFTGVDFSEIIFIIGHLGEQIKNYLIDRYSFPMKFVKQQHFSGLGHAIFQSKSEFETDEPVLIVLGDLIFRANIKDITSKDNNQIGVMHPDDPRKFGIVIADKNGYVKNMVEKPETPPSNLAIAGIYYFLSSEGLFNAIEHLINNNIKTKGEYQLTDAMHYMLKNGESFQIYHIDEWFDCGEKESLLKTNEVLLKKMDLDYDLKGNIVIPPVFIGEKCEIRNSIIGPNVSISEGAIIKNSIIKNSIIGIESTIENAILDRSLVGDNSYIMDNSIELNIGPDSELINN
ncbi:MAG: sugar phosphate nucleotidyltransferase [Brevinematia bacterium]